MYIIEQIYDGIIPMSRYDTEPSLCYKVIPIKNNLGDVDWWFTENEMERLKFKVATPAEVILYG